MSVYGSIIGAGVPVMKNCWRRRIRITFSAKRPNSKGQYNSIVLDDANGDNFNISVTGTKSLALTRDNGTITITNLEYDIIARIIAEELFRITIQAGYMSNDELITIQKGEISFISRKTHSRHDVNTYISFASEFLAAITQSRLNFTINSGVNIYSLLQYVCAQHGITKARISPRLKETVINNVLNSDVNTSTVIERALAVDGRSYYAMTDSSLDNNVISVTDLTDKRIIRIDPNIIYIDNGNPTVTSQGLQISFMPVMQFVPGDIIKLDNALLDLSSGTTTTSGAQSTFNTSYLDSHGQYMIQEINYTLQNRGNQFSINCTCRALDIVRNISM